MAVLERCLHLVRCLYWRGVRNREVFVIERCILLHRCLYNTEVYTVYSIIEFVSVYILICTVCLILVLTLFAFILQQLPEPECTNLLNLISQVLSKHGQEITTGAYH